MLECLLSNTGHMLFKTKSLFILSASCDTHFRLVAYLLQWTLIESVCLSVVNHIELGEVNCILSLCLELCRTWTC